MKYFNEIYVAAKKKDGISLVKLFKKGACIDTRSNTESLITPAGRLAQEGDLESAKYLVDFFGANPAFVAQGLYIANNTDEADKWLNDYDMNKAQIYSDSIDKLRKNIRHFAFEADIKPDTLTTHDTNHEAKVATGEFDLKKFKKVGGLFQSAYLDAAAHSGHIYLLERLYKKLMFSPLPSLDALFGMHIFRADIGIAVYRLQTKKLALHAMSFIKSDKFLAAILQKVSNHYMLKSYPYDIEAVMNQARKIRSIMESDKIGYSQALALCDQRKVDLPPLLQSSSLFIKKTKHVQTVPGTHDSSVQSQTSMPFFKKTTDKQIKLSENTSTIKTTYHFGAND